jgi:mannitol/fructose-specific phosphotransferase system IIA component
MSKNQISVEIPQDIVTQISTKFQEIKDLLSPYMGVMTVDERKTLPKMSDKSVAFVNKVIEYTLANPKFIPSMMDAEECKKDYTANQILLPLHAVSQQIGEIMKDTIMLTGHEAYVQALYYYGSVKLAAKAGDAEAKTIVEDLSKRFPNSRNSSQNKHDKE